MKRTRHILALALGLAWIGSAAHAADKKPNILVIWGDDIGTENISYYNRGMMSEWPARDFTSEPKQASQP